jgi:hypothetical protein
MLEVDDYWARIQRSCRVRLFNKRLFKGRFLERRLSDGRLF